MLSTAAAFGGMLASMGAVNKDAGGLNFSFHWSVPVLFATGAGLAFVFWRVVFRFEGGSDDTKKRRLKQIAAALLVVAFTSFFYPLRMVDPERRREVIFGIVLALVVLSCFGWLIYQTIRFVEASSREEEKRVDGE
jgi:hypothetical protein